MSDLRAAVVKLTRLIIPWSTTDLAELAQASLNRTQAYLSNLANHGVVVQDKEPQHWIAGPRAREWRIKAETTGPSYGHRSEYKRQRAILDRLKVKDWQARRAGKTDQSDAKVASSANLAILTCQEVTGVDSSGQEVTDMDRSTGRTLEEAAGALSCSIKTIRRMIGEGKLAAFRVGQRGLRIKTQELEEYQNRNLLRFGGR